MLSKRLPPSPGYDVEESLEVSQVYSVMGMLTPRNPLVTQRPFRSPHHTVSNAGLAGGGSNPRPGEISLAHKGVLFLDEMPEFRKDTLDLMRQRWKMERSPSPGFPGRDVPGGIYAGVRHESLQMRLVRRPLRALPLLPAGCGQLPQPHFRAASGQN